MTRHPLSAVSFRDPGGFVYEDEGCILCQDPEVQTREAGSPGRFSQSAMLGLIAEPRVHRERALLETGSIDLGRLLEGIDIFTRPD